MTSKRALIEGNVLTYQESGHPVHLLVGSLEWYAWLGSASNFTFHSEDGTFTARKERAGSRRGGEYWKAYRKRHGKLYRRGLGRRNRQIALDLLLPGVGQWHCLVPERKVCSLSQHQQERTNLGEYNRDPYVDLPQSWQ